MRFLTRALIFTMVYHATFSFKSQGADIFKTSSGGRFHYKYLGCYSDQSNRTLPIYLFSGRRYVDWKMEDYNFKEIIDMCATRAYNRSDLKLKYFGVQYFGECWGGKAGSRYDVYGKTKTCLKGSGKEWTNAVYEIILDCRVSEFIYEDGQHFYIPQYPVQPNDISCQSCSCDRGTTRCRGKIHCDFFFPCEKFVPAPHGKCCPTCACYHENKFYQDGEKWINHEPNACYECACVSNQASCMAMDCPNPYCPNPVYEPDKCCPTCHPGAPITQAPFTVHETTPRPPPVMPPFPGFPGNQKRSLKLKKISKRNKSW